jgi:hypothetical protein
MFDLPEPFGPTIDVIGVVNSSVVFFANDLKPESSRLFKYIAKIIAFFLKRKKAFF